MTAAGTQEVAEFTVLATEAISRVVVLEAPHASDSSLDAAMILLKAVVMPRLIG